MMNEVNIIETYSNNKNMQQEAVDTTKWFWQIETYITSPVFTYTNTSDLYNHPQSIFNWPKSIYTPTLQIYIIIHNQLANINKEKTY